MQYQVDPSLWSGVFAVPSAIVDDHLKLCGAASLKVLLLVLRRGGSIESDEIAAFLNLPPADVLDAMNYWVHLGVLRSAGDAPARSCETAKAPPQPEQRPEAAKQARPEPEAEAESPTDKPGNSRKRLSTRQIGEMGKKDENIAYLLQEAQAILCEPLTPVSTDTITALYAYYGMELDLILMLLGYCVSIEKTSMRYIEKVAAGWIEQGIDSHEKAEQEILKAQRRHKVEYRVRKLLGITDRALITREQDFLRVWTEEWGCSYDLIMLAYERTVEQKGKLSFAYMNGILQNWREKSITTPSQAVAEIQAGRGRQKQAATVPASASYDIGELESLTYGDITQ